MPVPPVIAIIAPGAMGSAVAKRLTTAGLSVLTNLDGRSPASRSRAREAGMRDVPLHHIARDANWVLSILPPSEAHAFALKFRDAYHTTVSQDPSSAPHPIAFADCNAVNPHTVKQIAQTFVNTPIKFIDAGIIGGPPRGDYDPVFYASADPSDLSLLHEFESLSRYGLKVSPLRGEGAGIGDASALKMSYAGITKGIIGIMTTMILAANESSPATSQALLHELASSQPNILQRMTTSIPTMIPKAYRWVGEMEEISQFVGGGPGHIHEGLARLYERVEASVKEDGEDVRVLNKFVEDAKKVINDQKK